MTRKKQEQRYVLLEILPNNLHAEDDYEDALTELDMLKMLADKLGYNLEKKP